MQFVKFNNEEDIVLKHISDKFVELGALRLLPVSTMLIRVKRIIVCLKFNNKFEAVEVLYELVQALKLGDLVDLKAVKEIADNIFNNRSNIITE